MGVPRPPHKGCSYVSRREAMNSQQRDRNVWEESYLAGVVMIPDLGKNLGMGTRGTQGGLSFFGWLFQSCAIYNNFGIYFV